MMEEANKSSIKKRIRVRQKINKKKEKRIQRWKKVGHQTFSLTLVLSIIPFLYFLVWGLIIEPNLPRHIYGPGDKKELIFLGISTLSIMVSYLLIIIINYRPLNMNWLDNWKLLHSVSYNLEKYSAYKDVGIKYSHQKKKKNNIRRKKSRHSHKSITE